MTFLIISAVPLFTAREGVVNVAIVGFVFLTFLGGLLRAVWLRKRDPGVYAGLASNDGI